MSRGLGRVAKLLTRLLLALAPTDFRREHGAEIAELHRRSVADEVERRGFAAGAVVAVRGWVGVVVAAAREWGDLGRGRREVGTMGRVEAGAGRVFTAARHAARSVVRRPLQGGLVVGLLGLGLGATLTVVSVIDGVLLRALPYPQPERLAYIDEGAHAWPDFLDWTENVPGLEQVVASIDMSATLELDGPTAVSAVRVSGGWFELFGARPQVGRLIDQSDLDADRHVAVLGHATWLRLWGGDPEIVGRAITIDGRPVEVVGVMSADFVPPSALTGRFVDVWMPVTSDMELDRNTRSTSAAGRIAEGASFEIVSDQLLLRAEEIASIEPDLYLDENGDLRRPWGAVPLADFTTRRVRTPLLILLTGAGLLLLVSVANASSLLLARGEARRSEFAARRALGAGNAVVQQLLFEGVILSLAGGVLGIGLAWFGIDLVAALEPELLPRAENIDLNARVVLFGVGTSTVMGIAATLAPALRAARHSPATVLRDAQTGTRGRSSGTGGRGLVIAEAALASLLVVGTLTVARGISTLSEVDGGFVEEGAWVAGIELGQDQSADARAVTARAIGERLAALPGVTSNGAGIAVPFEMAGRRCCWAAGLTHGEREVDWIWVHPVTRGYFEANGIAFAEGGVWAPDPASDPIPIVLNRLAADELFADGASPLGTVLPYGSEEERQVQVVGVIENVRHWGPDQDVEAEYYLPYSPEGTWVSGLSWAIRTDTPPTLDQLRDAVAEVAPRAEVTSLQPLTAMRSDALSSQRFYSTLLTIFAASALILAMAGLGGSLLLDARAQGHELGIRMALGADAGSLASGVLVRGLVLVALGAGAGFAAFLPLRGFLDTLVPGLDALDPVALVTFVLVMALAVGISAWLPARLVARTDPANALRG